MLLGKHENSIESSFSPLFFFLFLLLLFAPLRLSFPSSSFPWPSFLSGNHHKKKKGPLGLYHTRTSTITEFGNVYKGNSNKKARWRSQKEK